jgi:putative ABC transport system ATP-binding protein
LEGPLVPPGMAGGVLSAPVADAPLLRLRNLRFRWAGAAHDCIHIDGLELAAGESLFVRGPSGCGKSTLLSLVAGVLIADSGEARLKGCDWASLSTSRRDAFRADHVGYIFQQFNLLPYLPVLDNVLLPCRFSARRRENAGDAADTARRLLGQAGLEPGLWKRSASALSVGQQQRVAAVRALLGRPELVIADEPTSALDEPLRESFMSLLLGACEQAGSALIFVSHDARLASRFDRSIDLPAINRAGIAPGREAA